MNTLTLDDTADSGYSFELVVDGKPIGDWLEDGNSGIPYRIAGNGLPIWRQFRTDEDAGQRLVSLCSCEDDGCGHSRCTVRMEGDIVVFEDFEGDVSNAGQKLRFEFPREQFESVFRIISERSANYRDDA